MAWTTKKQKKLKKLREAPANLVEPVRKLIIAARDRLKSPQDCNSNQIWVNLIFDDRIFYQLHLVDAHDCGEWNCGLFVRRAELKNGNLRLKPEAIQIPRWPHNIFTEDLFLIRGIRSNAIYQAAEEIRRATIPKNKYLAGLAPYHF